MNYTDRLIENYEYPPEFEVDDDGYFCTLVKYAGTNANVVIPNGITEIGRDAFRGNAFIENVTIPNTVKSIEPLAFCDCKNLKTVNMSDKLFSIHHSAFMRCTSLYKITIPDSVKEVGYHTFDGCTSLTDVVLPKKFYNIVYAMFQDCHSLININIPDNLHAIDSAAFRNCKSLTTLDFFNTQIGDIENNAFSGCSKLSTLIFPNCLYKIYLNCLDGCINLKQVVLPANVKLPIESDQPTSCKIIANSLHVLLKLSGYDSLHTARHTVCLNPDFYINFPYYKDIKEASTEFDLSEFDLSIFKTDTDIFIGIIVALVLRKNTIAKELAKALSYSQDEIKAALKTVTNDTTSMQIIADKLNALN